jgi:hypothetical protein
MLAREIPITRTNLYHTYIEKEFRRETVNNRRLRIISDKDRVRLLSRIAARAFLLKRDQLDFEIAAGLVEDTLQPPRSEVESLTRDLLNRSFLQREGDTYRFAHKSLGEYLFATYIYDQLTRGNASFVQHFGHTIALAGMVLELFGGITKFDNLVKFLGIQGEKPLSRTTAAAYKFATYSILDCLDRLWTVCCEFFDDSTDDMTGRLHQMKSQAGRVTAYLELSEETGSVSDTKRLASGFLNSWKEMQVLVLELELIEVNRRIQTSSFAEKQLG